MRTPVASAFRFWGWFAGLAAPPGLAQAQAAPPPPPAPYALPFQLRPAALSNGVRLDTSIACWENASGLGGSTWVSGLIGTRRLTPKVGLLARASFVSSNPPSVGTEKSGRLVSNPLVGAAFLDARPNGVRRSLFAAATLSIGGGGGDLPKPGPAAALPLAIATRSAMDNALFATNYFTLVAGAAVARVAPQATVQVEATVLQLFRVRGPKTQDERRTNFTAGIHLGHFFAPKFSAGAELRYQRWLTQAAPVRSNRAARETVTFAIGPRLHFRLAERRWIRPAATLTWPLDDPLSAQHYRILQIDIPVSF